MGQPVYKLAIVPIEHGGWQMKKFLLSGVALGALVAGPAMAADLRVRAPVYRAPPPVVTYFSWTGCYVGGHVGGLWVSKDFRHTETEFFDNHVSSHDASGWLAGVQAGCNYQVGGWVFGLQGDYAWADAKGSHTLDTFDGFATGHSSIKSLASFTGRIGYAWDRFLGYVKAGGAWERDNYHINFDNVTVATAGGTRSGWTVGIGGEYAFTNNLSAFLEYNYYDFGSSGVTFCCDSSVRLWSTSTSARA